MLEVVDPGLLITLQDRGRPGFAHLGIPPSGAADPWGLVVANVLAGAPADAAAAEVTLAGAELQAVETCTVSLAGADLGAERDDGAALRAGAVHVLPAGSRLRFTGGATGLRAYLGLAGGIAARRVLGSAATSVTSGLGGVDGRAVRAGDLLLPVHRGDLTSAGRSWPERAAPHPASLAGPIRFVPGPDVRHLAADTLDALAGAGWVVARASDRIGLRLDGPGLAPGREILSHPVVPGAIQLPGDGFPLVLFVDGPTIGGYPVLGVVPRAELPRLGQLRPGDRVRFSRQDAEAARDAWRVQVSLLETVASGMDLDGVWLRLVGNAGG